MQLHMGSEYMTTTNGTTILYSKQAGLHRGSCNMIKLEKEKKNLELSWIGTFKVLQTDRHTELRPVQRNKR